MVEEQLAIEHLNMADYLNVTEKRLIQINEHTDRGSQLLASRIKEILSDVSRSLLRLLGDGCSAKPQRRDNNKMLQGSIHLGQPDWVISDNLPIAA